jgi:hypothetical protein
MIYDLALGNELFVSSRLAAAIQELDLLLNTECTELIGNTQFGVSIEQFLWTLTPTTEEFNTYIESKLNSLYYFNMFQHKISTEFEEGEFRSIYHLKIEIFIDEAQKINKEYVYR